MRHGIVTIQLRHLCTRSIPFHCILAHKKKILIAQYILKMNLELITIYRDMKREYIKLSNAKSILFVCFYQTFLSTCKYVINFLNTELIFSIPPLFFIDSLFPFLWVCSALSFDHVHHYLDASDLKVIYITIYF